MGSWLPKAIPVVLALAGAGAMGHWVASKPNLPPIELRQPGMDGKTTTAALAEIDLKGKLVTGDAEAMAPAPVPGSWPRFRGTNFDGISSEDVALTHSLKPGGPKKLWSVDVGPGYAGAAVLNGRVYVLDYDLKAEADTMRCLSLADGKEIWSRSYHILTSRQHGSISRTVPAVTDKYVVSLGPKCQVVCLDAVSGEFKWGIDLMREYKTNLPPWYAGQCPLIEDGKAILAPGAPGALLMAVDCESGKVLWKTPNPKGWDMTHSSIIPMSFKGRKMYLYCGSGGVVGASAEDGRVLWELPGWVVKMANVPSPLPIGEDRVFLSGGYGTGSMMIRLEESGGQIVPNVLFSLPPEVFGAEQQTPIFYKGYIYGLVPPTGQLVCLSLDGKQVWNSGSKNRFGLGPFMIADGMIILMNDTGTLSLVEATNAGFRPLGKAEIFEDGFESWGPFALAGGRLIARDLTRMTCLDLRKVDHD